MATPRFLVLATDYDGTLAHHGTVEPPTVDAMDRFRAAGRHLVMVTGRELDELQEVCGYLDRFEIVVAENGALLYKPATGALKLLAQPPPKEFSDELSRRGAERVSVGHVIVATWEPAQTMAIELIREMGLELQVIFNKGAVMILPTGINKATGLSAALREIGFSEDQTVGVGDAENDHAFIEKCGCGVAVANALEALKKHATFATSGPHGVGVSELMDEVLRDDLASRFKKTERA